ncbi:glycogen debranching N-terminal domain-containing protein [Arthrobacter sp. R4]|uniref:glycogen debranching N-terminal domain-containing protein n=1 Tax=Arthrobacter sp. R4 TaxID=644417 RepID=UPI003ED94CA7
MRNLGREPITARLVLRAGTDFADQFTVRTDGRTFDLSGAASSLTVVDGGALTFDYTHTFRGRTFTAGVELMASSSRRASLRRSAGSRGRALRRRRTVLGPGIDGGTDAGPGDLGRFPRRAGGPSRRRAFPGGADRVGAAEPQGP